MKLLSETECDILRNGQSFISSLNLSDEDPSKVEAKIGISGTSQLKWNAINERIIYAWRLYAGRYDIRTVLAHVADIRRFERAINLKDLTETTPQDAATYRLRLVEGSRSSTRSEKLSASTVRHAASYIKGFFSWLATHSQIPSLEAIPAYFELPKELHQSVPGRGTKEYITLEDAGQALTQLPAGKLLERRDRAVFALAYTGALRESALITLRLRHVDIEGKSIDHDGRDLRAKNGKSFRIRWFPGTTAFHPTVTAWIAEMQALGAGPDDALFPDATTLTSAQGGDIALPERPVWQPMKTAQAVDAVFRRASELIGQKVTPHSVRHTIARLGYQLCHDPEALKAWSRNMGHDSETTTLKNYGKMTEARKVELLELIERTAGQNLSDAEVIRRQQITEAIRSFVNTLGLEPSDIFGPSNS